VYHDQIAAENAASRVGGVLGGTAQPSLAGTDTSPFPVDLDELGAVENALGYDDDDPTTPMLKVYPHGGNMTPLDMEVQLGAFDRSILSHFSLDQRFFWHLAITGMMEDAQYAAEEAEEKVWWCVCVVVHQSIHPHDHPSIHPST